MRVDVGVLVGLDVLHERQLLERHQGTLGHDRREALDRVLIGVPQGEPVGRGHLGGHLDRVRHIVPEHDDVLAGDDVGLALCRERWALVGRDDRLVGTGGNC